MILWFHRKMCSLHRRVLSHSGRCVAVSVMCREVQHPEVRLPASSAPLPVPARAAHAEPRGGPGPAAAAPGWRTCGLLPSLWMALLRTSTSRTGAHSPQDMRRGSRPRGWWTPQGAARRPRGSVTRQLLFKRISAIPIGVQWYFVTVLPEFPSWLMMLRSFHATYLFLLRSKFQIFKWGTAIVPPVLSCESSLHNSGYKLYYQICALQVFLPVWGFSFYFY